MQKFGFILILKSVMFTLGICNLECDFDLVGPGCNFKNIAYRKRSRFTSNVNPPLYSYLANDNDLSTCAYTSDRNIFAPWWNLWIPEYTTLKKLEFITIESRRSHFQNFEVIVYNTSEGNFKSKGTLKRGIVCYQHNSSIPQETKIQVTCDGYPVGNLIRIQLKRKHYQLVLCDVRVYEDCKDEFYGKDCESCSNNCYSSGHIGHRNCQSSNGHCLHGCKSGWTGSQCTIECHSGKWGRNCREECGKCYTFTCDRISGNCLRRCAAGYKPPKCTEECDPGFFGNDCKQQCNRTCSRTGSAMCNNVNGTCINGCIPGYIGSYCEHECDGGRYGINCERSCSVNCHDVCDRKTGICSKCKHGWKGHNCAKECTYGAWGENCNNTCGKCKNEETCNRFHGACVNGCLPGYKHTDQCNDECKEGTYGDACSGNCSDTCKGVCNKVDGTCELCQNGWTSNFCKNVTISKDVGLNTRYTELSKIMSFSLGIISLIVILYYCITLLLRNV